MLQLAVIGLLASGAVAAAAYRFRALSGSGAAAAVAVGTVLFACGSLAWYGTLMVFFVSSTGWSKWRKRQKRKAESGYEKGGRRDAGQVLANGGLAALLGAAYAAWPSDWWWYAFVGVMASVNADTWATEIGGLSRSEPRSIVTWRRVTRGTSGAVSVPGSLAAAAGALAIGLSAALLLEAERAAALSGGWPLLVAAALGGLAGAFADSLLGATVQRMNRCTVCGAEVEQAAHCGRKAERLRGWPWMNNDAVNAVSSAVGGLVSLFVFVLCG